jgi:hypothetical protein
MFVSRPTRMPLGMSVSLARLQAAAQLVAARMVKDVRSLELNVNPSPNLLRLAYNCVPDLRIIRVSDPEDKTPNPEHKSSVGAGGYRLDASRNMWEGSGLKIDSAITDVAWCHGCASLYGSTVHPMLIKVVFNHKILTSARNGDLIMWDLNKTGPSKYGERFWDTT